MLSCAAPLFTSVVQWLYSVRSASCQQLVQRDLQGLFQATYGAEDLGVCVTIGASVERESAVSFAGQLWPSLADSLARSHLREAVFWQVAQALHSVGLIPATARLTVQPCLGLAAA